MAASRLFPTALRYLASLLESSEMHDFFRYVQPDRLRRDLMLYRQDLRMIIRRLTDDDLVTISTAFPERSAEILALIGDLGRKIEERDDVAGLGVAMVMLGGKLAEIAEQVEIPLPPTIFLGTRINRPVALPPDQRQRRLHVVLRRIKDLLYDLLAPFALIYYAVKGRSFFDVSDELEKPDFYPPGPLFWGRIFISYERLSLPLAEKFEVALRSAGLEPYRYEPEKKVLPEMREFTLDEFRASYPGIFEEIIRTVRRSSAVILILSEAAIRSPLCRLEAFVANMTFFPFTSGIYVVLETPGVRVPEMLQRASIQRYEPGMEDILAQNIAQDIERLASYRTTAEGYRRERLKKRPMRKYRDL